MRQGHFSAVLRSTAVAMVVALVAGLTFSTTALVTADVAAAVAPTEATNQPAALPSGASSLTAVAPTRVLDTRVDRPTIPATGSSVNLPLRGVGPIPNDSSVTAVVFNLTGVDAVAQGWVTAYPHGTAIPFTSSLNMAPGQVQAAQVTAQLGSDGSVDLFVSASMNLVVDVVGYYTTANAPVAAGRTEAVGPSRVLDTRISANRLAASGSVDVDLSGVVPANATAAVITLTGVNSAGGGWLSARPGGTAYDFTSSLNYDQAGDIVANQVIAQLSPSKTLTIQTFLSSVDVLVDVTGYVTGSTAPVSQRGLFVAASTRLLDTRDVAGRANGRQPVAASGKGGVPSTGVAGLAVNLTLTQTPAAMWAAALPVGQPAGATSTVNASTASQTVAAPGTVFDGTNLDVFLSAPAEIIVDLTGWYLAAAVVAPAQLTVAPTPVSFADTKTGATTTQTITLTNTAAVGSASLTVSGTSISGTDAASFSDTFNDASPVVLAPGASTTFDVSFSPSTTGAKTASVAIANDGSGGPATLPLSGTATTGPTPGQVLFRVNVGGPQVAGTPVWSADTANNPSPYVNGVTNFFDDPTTVDTTDPSVPAGTPAAIFQDQRYDVAGGSEMGWSFPVTPGDYQVRLYFAENYAPLATPGSRVFSVQAEGQTVVSNLDVGQAAGGAFKGIVRTFTVTADSSLDLTWLHGVENPLVQGIEVLTTSGSGPVQPALGASPTSVNFGTTAIGDTTNRTVTVTNTGANGAGSLNLTGATIGGTDANQFAVTFAGPVTLALGQSTNLSVDFAPTTSGVKTAALNLVHTGSNPTVSIPLSGTAPSSDGSTVLFRVNAGGPAVSGTPTWTGDTQASPSPYALNGGVFDSAQTVDVSDPSLPVGTPASLFRDERYDGLNEQWSFPTGAGTFQVRLYFAETSPAQSSVGARVMDVSVQGSVVLPNFDQFSEAGAANKGIMRAFTATAAGTLADPQPHIEVSLAAVTDVASIKAIEVVIPPVVAPTTVAATPVSVAFGNTTIGQTQSRTVTLTNQGAQGTGSVQITGATIKGPWAEEFSENYNQGSPVTLAPGASTTIDVTHLPHTQGIDDVTLEVTTNGVNSPIEIPITGSGVYPQSGSGINFGKSTIAGITGTAPPTSIKWGPDGRLYITRLDGTVQVATIIRNGPNSYSATTVDTITSIHDIPNHDDNGALNPGLTGRLVTGLEVVGTAQNPVIYLVSSDPRIGSPQTPEAAMDTNSGILSSLSWNGSTWVKRDLVAGFPRSKEQHSVEGVVKDPNTGHLLLMSGGQTNHGAPSDNFKDVPEYALSAAILDVDIAAVEAMPSIYNLPTLDDEDRAGVNDLNDPFGGNNGKNMAKLVPGGPVQIYASGLRNAYDSVYTSKGLYTADNGGNASWGGPPANEGPAGTCTNAIDNGGQTFQDSLYQITGPGQYFGHPNPARGNMANTFNASNPQSPVSVADARECDFWSQAERPALAHFTTSSNGIDQYRTANFNGVMNGDLVVAGWDNQIHLVELNADGSAGKTSTLAQNIGAYVLDIITGKSTDPFPGTLTVADFGTNSIYMFEPTDFDGTPPVCTGANSAVLDEDHDGYTNADEILNGTNPCSGADVPSDADHDHISDKLDPDDDNDGIPDVTDPFAVDPNNGLTTPVGLNFPWNSDTPQNTGILNLGLTGSMINGTTDWLSTYDETNMTIIGAAGVVTVDATPNGTALGAANTQMYGLQVGFDPRPTSTGTFEAATSLPNPYGSQPPLAGQSWGLQLGKGDQDNYMKIVASGANGGQMELVQEVGGVATTLATAPLAMPGPQRIDIFLKVDPVTKQAQAAYAVRTNNVTGPKIDLGVAFAVPASWFDQGMAAGLIATSGGAATPLTASWDYLQVLPVLGSVNAPASFGSVSADTGSGPSSTTTTTSAPVVATLPSENKK